MNPLITLQGVNPIQISALPKGMDIMELKMASGGIDFSNIGTVLEAAKEIRRLEAFERANLSFILSLTILKKIANVGEVEKPVNCAVCSISPAEIEKMTEQECDDLMYSLNLCVPHMVARIDLKKRFRLYGKARLKEMKRLGDASIWAKSPMEE